MTLGRHFIVDMHPDRTDADRDSRLRRLHRPTSLRDEGVVQGHRVHVPGPDQQRIRRVGGTEIAVAAALDDEAQVVLASEVDRGDDIPSRLGRHGEYARLSAPGIEPAGGLRQPDLVADVGSFGRRGD